MHQHIQYTLSRRDAKSVKISVRLLEEVSILAQVSQPQQNIGHVIKCLAREAADLAVSIRGMGEALINLTFLITNSLKRCLGCDVNRSLCWVTRQGIVPDCREPPADELPRAKPGNPDTPAPLQHHPARRSAPRTVPELGRTGRWAAALQRGDSSAQKGACPFLPPNP